MGLDMYLYTASKGLSKKVYQWHIDKGYWEESYDFWKKDDGIIGYWRKANAIHRWFVEHVQYDEDDCHKYVVKKEELNDLLRICGKVLINHSLAPELLPTKDGFFFGPLGYDEWYFRDIEYTYELCKFLLENIEEREDSTVSDWSPSTLCFKDDPDIWGVRIEYQSSW